MSWGAHKFSQIYPSQSVHTICIRYWKKEHRFKLKLCCFTHIFHVAYSRMSHSKMSIRILIIICVLVINSSDHLVLGLLYTAQQRMWTHSSSNCDSGYELRLARKGLVSSLCHNINYVMYIDIAAEHLAGFNYFISIKVIDRDDLQKYPIRRFCYIRNGSSSQKWSSHKLNACIEWIHFRKFVAKQLMDANHYTAKHNWLLPSQVAMRQQLPSRQSYLTQHIFH